MPMLLSPCQETGGFQTQPGPRVQAPGSRVSALGSHRAPGPTTSGRDTDQTSLNFSDDTNHQVGLLVPSPETLTQEASVGASMMRWHLGVRRAALHSPQLLAMSVTLGKCLPLPEPQLPNEYHETGGQKHPALTPS